MNNFRFHREFLGFQVAKSGVKSWSKTFTLPFVPVKITANIDGKGGNATVSSPLVKGLSLRNIKFF